MAAVRQKSWMNLSPQPRPALFFCNKAFSNFIDQQYLHISQAGRHYYTLSFCFFPLVCFDREFQNFFASRCPPFVNLFRKIVGKVLTSTIIINVTGQMQFLHNTDSMVYISEVFAYIMNVNKLKEFWMKKIARYAR